MHNAPELSDITLADAIEAECPGRTEWQIMNADETGLCMWFRHDDHTRPAHAAQQWLDEHPSKKAEGYHVVEVRLRSTLEVLAMEAAKRLRAAAAPPAAQEPMVHVTERHGTMRADGTVMGAHERSYTFPLSKLKPGAPDGHQQT